jgi:creatinine amidohydrolase
MLPSRTAVGSHLAAFESDTVKALHTLPALGDAMNNAARRFMNLTWPEVASFEKGHSVALVPVGQIVQHGPHLPVGTDVFQAEGVTTAINAELNQRGLEGIIGPTITFGNSPAQEAFPGYVNIRPEVLTDHIEDIASCLARQGLRKQAYILFGPGSWWPLYVVSTRLARLGTADIIVIDGLQTARAVGGDLLAGQHPASGKFDVHAGELETSLMLAICPDLVRMDKAVRHFSQYHATFASGVCTRGPLLQQMAAIGLRDWRQFGEEGVTGDATSATAAKGNEIILRVVKALAEHLATHLFKRPADDRR